MNEGVRMWASRALMAEEQLRQLGMPVEAAPVTEDFFMCMTYRRKDGEAITLAELADARTRIEAACPTWSKPEVNAIPWESHLG